MSFKFLLLPLLLVITAGTAVCLNLDDTHNSNSNNNKNNNDDKPHISWTSFNDVIQTLKAPHPTVETSPFGLITYRLQRTHTSSEKNGTKYFIWRGYDVEGVVRSVMVCSSDYIHGSFFSDMYSKSVTLKATPQNFTLEYEDDDEPTNKKKKCCDSNHHAAGTANASDDSRVFRASNDDDGFRPYKGDGTAEGVRVTMPDIRIYRIVYGSYEGYASGFKDGFEQFAIHLTESINILYERDFGIHLIYVGYSLSKENLDTNEFEGIRRLTAFFTGAVGEENYDVGMYMKSSSNYGGLCWLSGLIFHTTKGNCISDHKVNDVAHELGHLFGCPHPHAGQYSVISETGKGNTIMGYGDVKKNFGISSMMQVTRTFESSERMTKEFHSAKNTNNLPQVDTSLLKAEYHIPHSTQFRFIVDGNDPDEGDTLQYYVSQVNFLNTKDTRPWEMRHLKGAYMTELDGEPRVGSTGISSQRTFYFGPCFYVYSTPYTAAEIEEKGKKTASYDMFVAVYDWNTEKREAYFNKLDKIVTPKMEEMIKQRSDAEKYKELNETMWQNIHSIQEKPWVSTRGIYHTKVIAHSEYTPFTLDIDPQKNMYAADEEVDLKWNYDDRMIKPTDHVTIRFTRNTFEGVRCSYPYVVKAHLPASDKTVRVKMPAMNTPSGSGFFMIEHDEGIIYATTSTSDSDVTANTNDPSGATIGSFGITIPSKLGAKAKLRFSLNPSSPFIVLNSSMLQTQLSRYTITGIIESETGERQNTNEWKSSLKSSFLFADPSGVVLGQYDNFTAGTDAIMGHLEENKGKYYLLMALVYSKQFTVSIGTTSIYDLVYHSYRTSSVENYQHVTNIVEIKIRSQEKIRAAVPLQLVAEAGGSGTAFIEVRHKCDNECLTCDGEKVSYIADSQCHNVDSASNGESYRSYIAGTCNTADETFDIQVFPEPDCKGTQHALSLSSSCVAV